MKFRRILSVFFIAFLLGATGYQTYQAAVQYRELHGQNGPSSRPNRGAQAPAVSPVAANTTNAALPGTQWSYFSATGFVELIGVIRDTLFAQDGKHLIGLDRKTGEPVSVFAAYATDVWISEGVAVIRTGNVLRGTDPLSGKEMWIFPLDDTYEDLKVLTLADDSAIIISQEGAIELIDVRSGAIRWRLSTGESIRSFAVDGDHLYLIGGDSSLFSINWRSGVIFSRVSIRTDHRPETLWGVKGGILVEWLGTNRITFHKEQVTESNGPGRPEWSIVLPNAKVVTAVGTEEIIALLYNDAIERRPLSEHTNMDAGTLFDGNRGPSGMSDRLLIVKKSTGAAIWEEDASSGNPQIMSSDGILYVTGEKGAVWAIDLRSTTRSGLETVDHQRHQGYPETSATGTLSVRTSPARAYIFVDGENVGRAPLTLKDQIVGCMKWWPICRGIYPRSGPLGWRRAKIVW